MPLINRKVGLKPKWMKHCVLYVLPADNADANSKNIFFTIKGTEL